VGKEKKVQHAVQREFAMKKNSFGSKKEPERKLNGIALRIFLRRKEVERGGGGVNKDNLPTQTKETQAPTEKGTNARETNKLSSFRGGH